jgi:pyruvate dehydrogenase E2 component (dihydrolipoamide acetyltransferase)
VTDLTAVPPPGDPDAPAVAGPKGATTATELTRAQRTTARRVAESKATIPDFQAAVEADVTDLLALRPAVAAGGPVPSVTAFVVRAAGLALREHPQLNGAYSDGSALQHARVNVGVAVGGEGALTFPTVFDADTRPVTAIAQDVRALAAKVHDGTIAAPDLAGATFTVSNLGMHGVTAFTAVIQPGQAAILAVGAATERLALRDGAPVARQVLTLTLSADHRVVYGLDAAAFLGRLRELLENPAALAA